LLKNFNKLAMREIARFEFQHLSKDDDGDRMFQWRDFILLFFEEF